MRPMHPFIARCRKPSRYPKPRTIFVHLSDSRAQHGTSLIPRAAGTSLAGQVVGGGIVVDISRHLTRILEIDAAARRVRVQPGVVRNELNLALAPHRALFCTRNLHSESLHDRGDGRQ